MIFVGQGAPLSKAVTYAMRRGLEVECVCCPPGDNAVCAVKGTGVFLLETHDPNNELLSVARSSKDKIAFSINNRVILQDRLLESGTHFFNIHNGLTQQYRGVAQVCIFAALCTGERIYGVTLHEMPPGREIDSGPVVSQLKLSIPDEATFYDVLSSTLSLTYRVFELNVERIVSGKADSKIPWTLGKRYSYDQIPMLCREAPQSRLRRARDFGVYEQFFPKLRAVVDAECSKLETS